MSDSDRPKKYEFVGRTEVETCPNCGSTMIYSRSTKPPDKKWRCRECEFRFKEPEIRSNRQPGKASDNYDPDPEPETND